MILSDVLSHDVVVPSAGCQVESVLERTSSECVTGAAKAVANNVLRIRTLYIVVAVLLVVLVYGKYMFLGIVSIAAQRSTARTQSCTM